MSGVELKKMYSILSYPGDNNHDNFFVKGVYPYIKDYKFENILEAGCGTGAELSDIVKMYPKSNILAIDFTENSLKKAMEKFTDNSKVHFELVDLMSDKMKQIGKFDFIHCQGVLHHLDDPEKGLKNLVDCLKHDGKIYLWVYLEKGRQEISDIKELMLPFADKNLDTKLDIVKNLISLRISAKRNKKHKRYLNKSNKIGLLGNFAKFLLMVEQYGLLYSISKIRHIFLAQFFKNKKRIYQANIGLADTFLNPNEYFFNINELFELFKKNDLKVDFVVDGISRNLEDLGSGNMPVKKEIIAMDNKWKWRLIELFDEPRGVGVLCSKK